VQHGLAFVPQGSVDAPIGKSIQAAGASDIAWPDTARSQA
jgi:hypothetical protein